MHTEVSTSVNEIIFYRICSSLGTIYVGGMQLAIGTHGIIRPEDDEPRSPSSSSSNTPQRMHMKERLVVLSKLGQGASSIVYKVTTILHTDIVFSDHLLSAVLLCMYE